MTTKDVTPCPIAQEFRFVGSQAKGKANAYPSLAASYYQVDLEMKRAVHRRAKQCTTCVEQECRESEVLSA